MRPVKIETGYLATAEGSALIKIGNTHVLCAASVDDSVPAFLRGSGKGWVTAEYSMLPRATAKRTPREVTKGRPSGRTHEIQRLIGRSLRSVVDLNPSSAKEALPSIATFCRPMEAPARHPSPEPSSHSRSALQKLVEFRAIKKLPLRDYLAATSVGLLNGEAILDLCYEEDSRAEVDMNVAMTGSGKFVEVQATAEAGSFRRSPDGLSHPTRPRGHRRTGGPSTRAHQTPVTLFCATGNPGKLREFQLAARPGLVIEPISGVPACEENGQTFEEERNRESGLLRCARPRSPLLPTIPASKSTRSEEPPASIPARYAGDDEANNARVLREMEGVSNRAARFVCVIALAKSGRLLQTFRAEVQGEILQEMRGANGFGYDPRSFSTRPSAVPSRKCRRTRNSR